MKSFKSKNLAWLVGTMFLDIIVILVLAFPGIVESATLSKAIAVRASFSVFLPIPSLILASLLSPNWKACIVFWRISDPLPGTRAFSLHATQDPRIDLVALQKNVGSFPSEARAQNAKWYALYKLVASEPSVEESQRIFLLFRDIASVSIVLVVIIPLGMHVSGLGTTSVLVALLLFLGQYIVTALASRHNGIRFVQNVLAIHSSRKVPGAKPVAPRAARTQAAADKTPVL